MADSTRPGSGNLLPPWQPGESGNPAGSSKRVRARAAAKRVSGLAQSLREMLDEACPEDLLAELTPEQQAGLDGSPTLARYLAAKLVTSAAAAQSIGHLLSALQLIGTIDQRVGEADSEAAVVELPPLSPEAALAIKASLELERFDLTDDERARREEYLFNRGVVAAEETDHE